MPTGEGPRGALAWAGIATFALLSVLALAHLVADLLEVVRIWGASLGLLGRLGPPALLGLGSAVVLVVVVRLAGSQGRRLAGIGLGFLVLVLVRLIVGTMFDGVRDGEPREYEQLADAVLAGQCCMADRPMGYPILLAAAYATGIDRQVAVEAVNLVFAIVAGAAVLGIGRLLHGWRVGAAALVGYAVWPAGALMVDVRLPHTAYDALVAGAAWVAVARRSGWVGSALAGVVLGLAQYMRPSTLALLPAFALARIRSGARWRRAVGRALVPLVPAFLLVLVPAMWHNWTTYGELSVSTSTFGGHSLYIGTDLRTGGRFSGEANDELIAIAGPDPRARSEVGSRIAIDRIRNDPVGIALLAIRKQDALWATERYGVEYGISRGLRDRPANPRATTPLLLSQAFLALVFVATAAGIYLRREHLDTLAILAITLVWSVSLAHALLEVRDRHHAYVIPVLLPIAGVALVAAVDAVGSRMGRWRGARDAPSHPGPA